MSHEGMHRFRPYRPARFQVTADERGCAIDHDASAGICWVPITICVLAVAYVLIAVLPRLFA